MFLQPENQKHARQQDAVNMPRDQTVEAVYSRAHVEPGFASFVQSAEHITALRTYLLEHHTRLASIPRRDGVQELMQIIDCPAVAASGFDATQCSERSIHNLKLVEQLAKEPSQLSAICGHELNPLEVRAGNFGPIIRVSKESLDSLEHDLLKAACFTAEGGGGSFVLVASDFDPTEIAHEEVHQFKRLLCRLSPQQEPQILMGMPKEKRHARMQEATGQILSHLLDELVAYLSTNAPWPEPYRSRFHRVNEEVLVKRNQGLDTLSAQYATFPQYQTEIRATSESAQTVFHENMFAAQCLHLLVHRLFAPNSDYTPAQAIGFCMALPPNRYDYLATLLGYRSGEFEKAARAELHQLGEQFSQLAEEIITKHSFPRGSEKSAAIAELRGSECYKKTLALFPTNSCLPLLRLVQNFPGLLTDQPLTSVRLGLMSDNTPIPAGVEAAVGDIRGLIGLNLSGADVKGYEDSFQSMLFVNLSDVAQMERLIRIKGKPGWLMKLNSPAVLLEKAKQPLSEGSALASTDNKDFSELVSALACSTHSLQLAPLLKQLNPAWIRNLPVERNGLYDLAVLAQTILITARCDRTASREGGVSECGAIFGKIIKQIKRYVEVEMETSPDQLVQIDTLVTTHAHLRGALQIIMPTYRALPHKLKEKLESQTDWIALQQVNKFSTQLNNLHALAEMYTRLGSAAPIDSAAHICLEPELSDKPRFCSIISDANRFGGVFADYSFWQSLLYPQDERLDIATVRQLKDELIIPALTKLTTPDQLMARRDRYHLADFLQSKRRELASQGGYRSLLERFRLWRLHRQLRKLEVPGSLASD